LSHEFDSRRGPSIFNWPNPSSRTIPYVPAALYPAMEIAGINFC
jgi:hypothetical protein